MQIAMADVLPIRTASAVNHELSLSDGGAEAAVRSSWVVKTTLLAVVYAREAFLVHLDMPCTLTRSKQPNRNPIGSTQNMTFLAGNINDVWSRRYVVSRLGE